MNIEDRLSIKQLRAFVAVYRLRKLASAATQLSVTQPAVSVLIRNIEEVLETRLFDRSTRTLEPTQAAHDAIGLAERILHDLSLLGTSFRELNNRQRGRIRLAVTPAVGMSLMPSVVRDFVSRYPDIQLKLDDCAPDQFLSKIVSEQVDFGIGTPDHHTDGIELQTLIHDHLCLVCDDTHPLAGRRHVRWAELAGVPLIAVRPGYGVRRMIDAAAAKMGVDLMVTNEVGFLSSALWMTSSGLGVSIWPSALLANAPFKNLTFCRLVEPEVTRSISLVKREGRSLSPAAESFVEMLKTELAKQVGLQQS